jgi:hypothetical protein
VVDIIDAPTKNNTYSRSSAAFMVHTNASL